MPFYEYRCKECKTEKEELQGYDAPPPKCVKCKEDMQRLISKPAFHLKGGGWYKDHYGLKKSVTNEK